MKDALSKAEVALLRGLADRTVFRSGRYLEDKANSLKFSFRTVARLEDRGLVEFAWRGFEITAAGRSLLAEIARSEA